MGKSKIISGLIAILAITVVLTGCGGGTETPPATTSPAITTTPATSATSKSTQTQSGDTLSEILGRAQNISTLKYTLVITQPGSSAITQTVWVKKNKMRMEMSLQGVTSIGLVDFDAQTMYTYMPEQNIAVKVTVDQASKPATQEASSIAAYNPKNLGTESIDGIVCYVWDYNFENGVAKMWISKDHGLPVRVEQTIEGIKTVAEYKNYEFTDIPDSTFELPAGVQIMQAGQ